MNLHHYKMIIVVQFHRLALNQIVKTTSPFFKNLKVKQNLKFEIDSQIATIVDKNSMGLIDLKNNTQTLISDSLNSKCCSFDMSCRSLAVGTTIGTIQLYDLKGTGIKRKKEWRLQANNDSIINCICWSKNSRYIATGNSEGSIVLFNSLLSTPSRPLNRQDEGILSGVTDIKNATMNVLCSSYDDGSVIQWDIVKEKQINHFKTHKSTCTSICPSPLNTMLMMSGGLDGIIACYDTQIQK
jgi:WD40 repeat protein